jgi:hypothetical protein
MYQVIIFLLLVVVSALWGYILVKRRTIYSSSVVIGEIQPFSDFDQNIILSRPDVVDAISKYLDSRIKANMSKQNEVTQFQNNVEQLKTVEQIYIEKWEMRALLDIKRNLTAWVTKGKNKESTEE